MLTNSESKLNTTVFIPSAGHVSVSRRDLRPTSDEILIAELSRLIDLFDKRACNEGVTASKALKAYETAIEDGSPRFLVNAYWDEYTSRVSCVNVYKEGREAAKAELIKLQNGGES
jgi:hypothetical protein